MTIPHKVPRASGAARPANVAEFGAISISLTCLLHCLALPLLLAILPATMGLWLRSDALHTVLLLLMLPAAVSAFLIGHRHHRSPWPLLLGVAGFAGLSSGLAPGLGAGQEVALTVLGSFLLIGAHIWNWRLRNRATAAGRA